MLPKRFLAKVLELKMWTESESADKKVEDAFNYDFISREAWRYHCFNALHPNAGNHARPLRYVDLAEDSDNEKTDDEEEDVLEYPRTGEWQGWILDDATVDAELAAM